MIEERSWNAATWDGSRKAQLRRALGLTVQQRLQELGELNQTARQLATSSRGYDASQARTSAGVAETPTAYELASGQHEFNLAGCNPVPLAGYLKALGVLRLVAEQVDPETRGYWCDDQFVLITKLDEPDLRKFLLEDYRPTSVLAPWNGGSGFYPKDNQSGIQPIESGAASRLAELRGSIALIRELLASMNLDERPDKEIKPTLIHALRNELPDAALAWLDAAILLTGENPKYPPLLGTGGNDGRLDFTNNFMQRLVDLVDPETGQARAAASVWLDDALFARPAPELCSAAVGQFAPGNAGGPNAASGFEGGALVNPWDFVLMIEGALMFAAAATRRLESAQPGTLSYPFTVRSTGSGSGSAAMADEGNARAEIWLPLWSSPSTLFELKALFSEGRATLGRRPVRDGLDFARAVSRLSVDRGLEGFQRYAFMMRSGKAYLATPLNRIDVVRNPAADLIADLESANWLDRFRRMGRGPNASARLRSLLRRLEDAIFELTLARDDPSHNNRAPAVQRLLIVLGEAQLYLARNPSARDLAAGGCPPVPWLSAGWLIDDGSDELAISAALASLHARKLVDNKMRYPLPMRVHLAPESGAVQPAWLDSGSHLHIWGQGRLEVNLYAVARRRLLAARKLELDDKPFYFSRTCNLAAVARWLAGDLDTARITSLVPGLALIKMPRGGMGRTEIDQPLPMIYRLLKPFFCTDAQLREAGLLTSECNLPIPGELIQRLAGNNLAGTIRIAVRQLRIAGLSIDDSGISAPNIDGLRLLAALLVPVSGHEIQTLLPMPESTETPRGTTS